MLQCRDPWLLSQGVKKKQEISLRTKVKSDAQVLAIPHVAAHRKRLAEAAKHRNRTAMMINKGWLYPLGKSTLEDGSTVMADENVAWIKDPSGSMREVRNSLSLVSGFEGDETLPLPQAATISAPDVAHFKLEAPKQPKGEKVDPDQRFFDDWEEEKKPGKYPLREAQKAWRTFKAVCEGKLIKDCHRPDGRAVVKALQGMGMKAATVNKHMSYLNSISNIAISNGHLSFNPFSRCLLDVDDEAERNPLNEDEMKLVRDRFGEMAQDEKLLWVMLATTGMRLDEPFQIKGEQESEGIRYVIIGTKTDSSERRVPLPNAALPFLPSKITGKLFNITSKSLGARLRRRMREFGVTREGTTLHSLRHRAKDRMRDSRDPEIETKINDAITGHGEVTVGDGYGKGEAIWKLKRAIDVIGY